MPLGPTYQAQALDTFMGDATPTPPATFYAALFLATPAAALSSGLTAGTAYTSLPVAALSAGIAAGSVVGLTSGSVTQWWQVTTAANEGDTAVTVQSQVAQESFASATALTVIQFTEPGTGVGYSRQSVDNNSTNFPASTTSGGVTTKTGSGSVTVTWGPSDSPGWGIVAAMGLMDAETAGNVVSWAPSTVQVNVNGPNFTITETLDNFSIVMTSAN